ncbi:cytochrome b5 [Pseudovirgaria hyperparasitica]|uniref:Cytochrome b5 n=1 Tax=Pseudovirgaria hyperparasitica TaxID=470096 RepID=A0A6A6VYJ2_9PEZI|nr:cytochrome b5 [Pseudovirgaria hyperparasitica]KAF2755728.1 cytochrome b5 [Pseudovirgaria hyperparasitica]
MADKEYTYSDVSEHASKKDLFIVVHDKVYNASGFVDEHPGGEEVLLDVGGQDATEAFEDVGHSDEAREILDGMLVGTLKRQVRFHPSFPISLHKFQLPCPNPISHIPHLSHININIIKSQTQ